MAYVEATAFEIEALHGYGYRASAADKAEHAEKGQLKCLTVSELGEPAAQKDHAHGSVYKLIYKAHCKQHKQTRKRHGDSAFNDIGQLVPKNDIQQREHKSQRGEAGNNGTAV